MAADPERIEGPTPAGGAYALIYRHDDGTVEIVEFNIHGREIRRTYSAPESDESRRFREAMRGQ